MTTIKDYLKYYKNVSFQDSPFNEVDNIFFSELAYLHWDNIVTKKINLNEAINIYLASDVKEIKNNFLKEIVENLKIIKDSKRYENCYLNYYLKDVTNTKQFGALCIYLDKKTVYVAFEGTDNTISGWKENFMMSYLFPIESQLDAIKYLKKVIGIKDQIIYIGGHSKGGNLAIISAMYAKKSIRNRIKTIFNNDGPGVSEELYNSLEFKNIKNKIKLLVPSGSIVGELLFNPDITKVIKSSSFSVFEHDCNTWECFGQFFIEDKLTKQSLNLNTKTKDWLKEFDINKRKEIIETIFSIIEKANIKDFTDLRKLNYNKIKDILNDIKNVDEDTKKLIIKAIKLLIFNKKNAKTS